jgi:putative transposase
MRMAKEHPDFITITNLEWKNILTDDRFKKIILDSLSFLTLNERIDVFAFVIMPNLLHMIWANALRS